MSEETKKEFKFTIQLRTGEKLFCKGDDLKFVHSLPDHNHNWIEVSRGQLVIARFTDVQWYSLDDSVWGVNEGRP